MNTQAILPAKPASPIKGRNNVRVRFPFDLTNGARRALWAAIPAAHCYQSSYGGVVRYISPEAAEHFAAEIAALKDQAAQIANKKEIKAKIIAKKEAIAKQLARNPINAQRHDRKAFFEAVAAELGAICYKSTASCKHTYHHFVMAQMPTERWAQCDGKPVRAADGLQDIGLTLKNRDIAEDFGRTVNGQPRVTSVKAFAAWLKAHPFAGWNLVAGRVECANRCYRPAV
jgi:hypothetical protein